MRPPRALPAARLVSHLGKIVLTSLLMLAGGLLACSPPRQEARQPSGPGPSGAGQHGVGQPDAQRHVARVVCLTPSITEIVWAIGAGSLVVGVDRFSNYPKEVQALPKVGDFLSPSLEEILRLKPDLVVSDAVQARIETVLRQAGGARVLSVPMQTIEDVRRALLVVGDALGHGEGARGALAELDAAIAAAATTASARQGGPKPRVLFVVDRQIGGLGGMVAAGPDTHLHELLSRAGAVNVLVDAPVRYVRISPEEVIARRPDVILDASHTTDIDGALADWQVLSFVPAVSQRRVYVLGSDGIVSPGPRLGSALRRLTALLWPGDPSFSEHVSTTHAIAIGVDAPASATALH
ncbi:MAG: helical backbone metal receptor [Pseudomonadota bacterium]